MLKYSTDGEYVQERQRGAGVAPARTLKPRCVRQRSVLRPHQDLPVTRRAKVWLVVADVFALVNLAGAVMAAVQGELLHTTVHLGLVVLGLYLVWRVGTLSRRQELPDTPLDAARLEQLQQSVDAIALEVERIGESQRFNAKLQSERIEKQR